MTPENSAPTLAASQSRQARAAFVHLSLKEDRWSIRQAALALGMSHTALSSRLRADTAFLADEIEGLAHLLRRDPVDYFRLYIEAGTQKAAPTPEGGGGQSVHPLGLEPRTH